VSCLGCLSPKGRVVLGYCEACCAPRLTAHALDVIDRMARNNRLEKARSNKRRRDRIRAARGAS
jgi:hypothetical protein